MANYAYLTIGSVESLGSLRAVLGTLALVSDGTNYESINDTSSDVTGGGASVETPGLGGIGIRMDANAGATDLVSSEEMLVRRLGLLSTIKQFIISEPLTLTPLDANNDNQGSGYVGAVKFASTYAKLMLLTTGASGEAALAEPDGTAVATGTFTAPFIAIGK